MENAPSSYPLEIPLSSLSDEARRGLIESFILREGTDYGAVEISLEQKSLQVLRQIEKGEVLIVFDPATESIDLLTAREFKNRKAEWLSKSSDGSP